MRFTGANDSTRSKVVAKYPGDPDYNLKPCQPAPVVSLSRFALPCYSPWFRRLDARLQRPGVAYCATLRGARRGQFCLTLRLVSFRADWKPIVASFVGVGEKPQGFADSALLHRCRHRL
jgi:hypothetical protein